MKKLLSYIYYQFYYLKYRYINIYLTIGRMFLLTDADLLFKRCVNFIRINKIEGDYLEFGTYKGNSLIIFYHIIQNCNLKTTNCYAFDSFEGLPELTGIDKDFEYDHQYSCSLAQVKKNLLHHKVDLRKVHFIKCWYDKLNQSIKDQLRITKAAIIHFDCDLYSSTRDALKFSTSYVQDGTMFIFNDWLIYKGRKDRGQIKAFNEWLDINAQFTAMKFQSMGKINIFIIHNHEPSVEKLTNRRQII